MTAATALRRPLRYDEEWDVTTSLFSMPWMKALLDRIDTLTALQANWDSYGASTVPPQAVKSAKILVSVLRWDNLPLPHISAVPDGSIGFQWRVGHRDLEVEIDADGAMLYSKLDASQGKVLESGETTLPAVNTLTDWVLGIR